MSDAVQPFDWQGHPLSKEWSEAHAAWERAYRVMKRDPSKANVAAHEAALRLRKAIHAARRQAKQEHDESLPPHCPCCFRLWPH